MVFRQLMYKIKTLKEEIDGLNETIVAKDIVIEKEINKGDEENMYIKELENKI